MHVLFKTFQNLNGDDPANCELSPEGWHVQVENFYKKKKQRRRDGGVEGGGAKGRRDGGLGEK